MDRPRDGGVWGSWVEYIELLERAFIAADLAIRQSSSREAGVAWSQAREDLLRWRRSRAGGTKTDSRREG